MGIWSKIGKIALTAAPYIAAPFTGGASLAFAPMANKAVGAWSAHDAQKRAETGIAPSSFDKYLGMAGDMASMAGGAGAFGGAGSSFGAGKFNTPASSLGGKMGTIAKVGQGVMDRFGGQGQGQIPSYGRGSEGGRTPPFMPQGGGMGQLPQIGGGNPGNVMSSRMGGIGPSMGRQQQLNPMGMMDQNNPNLSAFIGQGRAEAIQNQPFRRGYDVNYLGSDDETPYTARMPRIGPTPPRRGGGAKKKQQES